MKLRTLWILAAIVALPLSIFGCEKVGPIPSASSTPTPTSEPSATPTGSASPSACATMDPTNPNLVLVAVASGFIAANDPTYGPIAGYDVVDPTGASPPPASATVINTTVGGSPITTADSIQFVNLEPAGANILHSAVGFTGSAFPAKPYAFPSPMASPTASAISNSSAWSTGLMGSPLDTTCFSQEFRLSAGTFYFGDYDYYNLTTFQDVLVVATPGVLIRHPRR